MPTHKSDSEYLRVSEYVPLGQVLEMNPYAMGLEGPSYFAIHPTTWERLPEESRELLATGPAMVSLKALAQAMRVP